MQELLSFNNSTSDIKIKAKATRIGAFGLKLIYQIEDLKNLLELPSEFSTSESSVHREDGLWHNTCFELFLRPKGQKNYYEFNFSLKPAWNEFYFESYRQPQPPQRCDDIKLLNMSWNDKSLEIELAELPPGDFEISLTAVIKEKSGLVHYMALKHAGLEADFHHIESFSAL